MINTYRELNDYGIQTNEDTFSSAGCRNCFCKDSTWNLLADFQDSVQFFLAIVIMKYIGSLDLQAEL